MEAKDITERGSEINKDIRGEIHSRLARAHLLAFLFPSQSDISMGLYNLAFDIKTSGKLIKTLEMTL